MLGSGVAGEAQAGIRGLLSVYNQSANPYHVFVEGQRIGTVFQGQTLRVNVQDWQGPTELVAIQAGSRGQRRFVQQVRTCQFVRWELHTNWEQLRAFGGPTHCGNGNCGPAGGAWNPGGQVHNGPVPNGQNPGGRHGGGQVPGSRHGGGQVPGGRQGGGHVGVGPGDGWAVPGPGSHHPNSGQDLARSILAIIAAAQRH